MKRLFVFILTAMFTVSFMPLGFADTGDEIQALKAQVQGLMKRIEQLEQEQAKTKEELGKTQTAVAGRVDLANTLAKLKIKGRAAIGFFDSGKAGSYPAGSFEMPDAKIQFSFEPDNINTVVMRFSLNNATAQTPLLDYFFLQSKDFLTCLKDTPFSLSSRLGRYKLSFGEETWSNNAIDGALPSNSAGNLAPIDEGLELAGKIKLDKIGLKPLGWVVSVNNGNSGVGSDSTAGKAWMTKLYYTPIDPLYLSATYYNSGRLDSSNAEMTIAGLATRPSGENDWDRSVWELDGRYDFGKGKKPLDPPVFSDSKAIVRLSYGGFKDDANKTRNGNFGFVDGLYNLNKKFYTAGRYSFVDLSGDGTATLNSVTANKYDRYSLGLGYRWSENTILKLGYDWNKSSGPGVDDADDNQLCAVVASQF